MNLITDTEKLVITEGEFDCMAVWDAGAKNVVSIPFGTENFEWVNECWDWLEQFKEIVILFDNDDAGKKAANEALKKLGIGRVLIATTSKNDANEEMYINGKESLLQAISEAREVSLKYFLDLSQVEDKQREGMLFGIPEMDNLLGGCGFGDLTVWTGKRGGGKSTILSQTVIDTVDQNQKLFWYSGELKNSKVREWLEMQMCSEKYLDKRKHPLTQVEEQYVPTTVSKILREWYQGKIFVYGDNGGSSEDDLLEMFEYAYRRHDIRRFIIDNLKTVRFTSHGDFIRQQANFVARCKAFCNKFDVHIDLVAHPRKTANARLEDEDVGGSVDIIDLADSVIVCSREKCEDIENEKVLDKFGLDKTNKVETLTKLKILKDRAYGNSEKYAYYKFDKATRRIQNWSQYMKKESRRYEYINKIERLGEVEQYQNGANQHGYKKTSEVEIYNTMIKNYNTVIKQLLDLCPITGAEQDELISFINKKV